MEKPEVWLLRGKIVRRFLGTDVCAPILRIRFLVIGLRYSSLVKKTGSVITVYASTHFTLEAERATPAAPSYPTGLPPSPGPAREKRYVSGMVYPPPY